MPKRQRLTSIVLMGVAGAGKSSVMAALAERLGWPTPRATSSTDRQNVAKMAAGISLTDADRAPWLEAISAWIGDREAERRSSLTTCSALRRRYRDQLRRGHLWVWFVHLNVPREVLETRMEQAASGTSCPRRCSNRSSRRWSRWSRTSPARP